MGKGLQHQDPSISPESPPGCMWILHRKRLPRKRKGGGKRVAVVEDLGDNATATESSLIVSKIKEPNQVSKSSMLSRIRSLITQEETSKKRKGRHRRSSSCPIQLERTNSIQHLDLADLQSSHDKTLEHTNYKEMYSVASLLDPPTKKIRDRAVQEPMEVENMRNDSSKLMLGFIKSISFPSRRSRGRKAVRSRKCRHHAKGEEDQSQVGSEVSGSGGFNSNSVTSTDLSSDDDVGKNVLIRRAESFDNASACSPRAEKKDRESSKLILNRFKNLKQKIRYALEESRKERHRIFMDAVLHKVPHGHRSSKDIEKGSTFAHCNSPFTRSEKMTSFRRTSSVNESLHKYNGFLDSSFYREEKHHISDRSSFRTSRSPSPGRRSPIGLDRILSMPDLTYYNSFKCEDSPERGSSYTLDRATSSSNLYVGICKSNEQKSLDIPLGSENHTEKGYNSDSKSTIFLDVSERFDDFGGLRTRENSSPFENIIEGTSSVVSNIDKPIPVPLPDMIIQNATSGANELSAAKGAVEDAVNTDKRGLSSSDLNRILQIQVDKRYECEFNYVKDVLELSGFSGDKIIGKWHSADKPVNPSLFDEVEGYCLLDQEGVTCDQLLLFDLINEVLLQIYERSCSYWPKSLTCHTHIHTMPIGYHVLGEVWKEVTSCFESEMKNDQPIDDVVSRDLAKDETWMNLQFDAVCGGLELEDLILNDLLEELVFT
ncbi:uncharacterized protein LOC107029926 isoform X1 [Solanum pennellii]|uniref:Uncharacterized protein LOC107029926 isoform X1 n=1 Tax=Solanum pennellii TaxID=28526 RepID=A0ABM1VHY9_SOLPN|nr:uncharacterized protein LOC107029926 isoform X1 [Solanum pennellii]XP_027775357.1 uncharacterized protein LOC107029926 isoform X1 [Solanum pennellii]XP_027775358.1 uncharacterized protein LOC107029926 isoform X1 [Solanum pennellii]